MASGVIESLSADVKITAYLKFRRVYGDALKARKEERGTESGLLLGRSLLSAMRILAAARDERVPGPGDLPDWSREESQEVQRFLIAAFTRGSTANRFAAAAELDTKLRRALPSFDDMWESGRMRFELEGFSTDTLFFPEEAGGMRGWLDKRRDRGELVPGARKFFDLLKSRSPKTGKEYRENLKQAYQGTPDLEGILVFGSCANSEDSWSGNGEKDVDLAFVGKGAWFRRGLCRNGGIRLDTLRFPVEVLEAGIASEDDLINNGLASAEILMDAGGALAGLQSKVREKYSGGKKRPEGEERQKLRKEMGEWVEWAKPQGEPLSDWIGLEVGLCRVLAIGHTLAGRWFPPDQDIVASVRDWCGPAADPIGRFVDAQGPDLAVEHLEKVATALGEAAEQGKG